MAFPVGSSEFQVNPAAAKEQDAGRVQLEESGRQVSGP